MDRSGVLLRLPPCGPQHERGLAVCLHVDYARVPEDRDLLPQDLFALLQLQAATVDREPGELMSIGRNVANLLLVPEAHVKEVEFCRSAINAAARPTELSKDYRHRSVPFNLIRGDGLAHGCEFSLRSKPLDPQVKYPQRLARGVSGLMRDDTSRLHPGKATCGDFAPFPGRILE